MNNALWHFDPEHHKVHIHPTASTASTTGVEGTQLTAAPLPPQPSMGDSIFIDQIVQDATDLERNLLMGTAFFKPANSFGTPNAPDQHVAIRPA